MGSSAGGSRSITGASSSTAGWKAASCAGPAASATTSASASAPSCAWRSTASPSASPGSTPRSTLSAVPSALTSPTHLSDSLWGRNTYWYLQHLRNLPELSGWTDTQKGQLVSKVVWLVTLSSIAGTFAAALLARWLKYRRGIARLFLASLPSALPPYPTPPAPAHPWYR